jgi:uncharacterized membrane protein
VKLPWQKTEEFLTEAEKQRVVSAIKEAERQTSGEIRLFIESHCRFVQSLDRAEELFFQLKMTETAERNATLIYVAIRDHQAAIYGDKGIHEKVGTAYWQEEIGKMFDHFRKNELAEGLIHVITDIGEALRQHFPYNSSTDKNELPDEIVFGT